MQQQPSVLNVKFPIIRTAFYLLIYSMTTGCATSDLLAWEAQIKSGQCADALKTVDSMNTEFQNKLMMKGAVYNDCYQDLTKAYAYMTLAARYGQPVAIEYLVERGQPVPPADLAGTTKRQLTLGEAALLGISQGIEDYNKNQPPPSSPIHTDIDCRRTSKDNVNCRGYSR